METNKVFLIDEEFEALFGQEFSKAIKILDRYAERYCPVCGGKCCQEIGCGFYSQKFDSCPIYDFRPAKCRIYHCKEILENESLSSEEKELLNKPVKDVSGTIEEWAPGIFHQPPLKIGEKDWLTLLGVEKEIREVISALENNEIDCNLAKDLLKEIIETKRRC